MKANSFNQLCVWQGTVVGKDKIDEFEKFMADNFGGVRIKYEAEVLTNPTPGEEGTGGRNDLFFYIHDEDVAKFAIPRLKVGIRWWEDVLLNGHAPLYSQEFLDSHKPTWGFEEEKKEVEMENKETKKPSCKLVGTDGNVFAIIGKVSGALKKAGLEDKAHEFQKKAFNAGTYEEVLNLCHEYVKVS